MKIEIANKDELVDMIAREVIKRLKNESIALEDDLLLLDKVSEVLPKYLTTSDIEHYLEVSATTVRKWANKGLIDFLYDGKSLKFPSISLINALKDARLRLNGNIVRASRLKYLKNLAK